MVTPLHKNGDKSDACNYRPISLLSVFSKVFEQLVLRQLQPVMQQVIHCKQHGFMKNRSTTTNLLVYEDYISKSMESGCEVDTIYTDFSKAFDKVDHALLISKLHHIGIGGILLKWFASYLHQRSQWIKVRNFVSVEVCVPSGVPQGSHLGPLLFNLFINDISLCFANSECLMFADDLKIYRAVRDINDSLLLQDDLKRLYEWSVRNRLPLNLSKCCSITFTRCNRPPRVYVMGGSVLKKCDTVTDLGVTFNSRLGWGDHINKISARALKQLGFVIRNTRDFNNLRAINLLYCSLVRSILEYGCVVWSPNAITFSDTIEKVQRKYLRHINFRLRIPADAINYNELLMVLDMQSLSARRKRYDLSFLYDLLHGKIDCSDLLQEICLNVPSRALRTVETFHIKQCRSDYRASSPLIRMCKYANSGPDVFHVSRENWLRHI